LCGESVDGVMPYILKNNDKDKTPIHVNPVKNPIPANFSQKVYADSH
jgi:hypothetical protein